jgi:hypothetical protein
MEPVRNREWNLNNEQVIILAGVRAEQTALKHNLYICQNDRKFRSSRYVAFYKEGVIRYLFELVDAPYKNCNEKNTPALKNVLQYKDRDEPTQVMYLKKVADIGPIYNDTLDKNGSFTAFTQGHRYTTHQKIMRAKRTSELI